MSRVTSVELDEDDVEYVDKLMQDGRVRSLKEFVEVCVKFGRLYTMDRWEQGLFHIGPMRVVITPQKILAILIERLQEEEYEDVGRDVGEIIKSFAMFQSQIDTTKNWDEALRLMSDFGLGQFSRVERDSLQVTSPTLPHSVMRSCMETILDTKLETVQMKIDVHFFKILKTQT